MASENASIVDEWLEDDKLMLLEAWARDGYTLSDIADRIGISRSTLTTWKNKYEEIRNALNTGREVIDYKVENALLKAALGYTSKEIKVTVGKQVKNGQTFMITKETTYRDVPPNVTACAMWLNNRLPDKWKRNRDKTIELEDEDSNVNITIVRGPKNEEENKDVNKEISISSKNQDNKNKEKSKKEDIIKDRDYWPDDWEDED